jgi:hypothetical protein
MQWEWPEVTGDWRTPLAISAKMQPMLQMSTGSAYLRVPSSTSGARYQSVTTCNHNACTLHHHKHTAAGKPLANVQ